MTITINRRSLTTTDTASKDVPKDVPKDVKVSATSIPRGRGYLRTTTKEPRVSHRQSVKPQIVLEQSLDLEYNVDIDSGRLYPKCDVCKDKKRVIVIDDCLICCGKGCYKCENTGEVINYINCQSCNTTVKVYR